MSKSTERRENDFNMSNPSLVAWWVRHVEIDGATRERFQHVEPFSRRLVGSTCRNRRSDERTISTCRTLLSSLGGFDMSKSTERRENDFDMSNPSLVAWWVRHVEIDGAT